MSPLVDAYRHRTGEHCASTALRNLLAHHGTELSEDMIFGLSAGLGFFYLQTEGLSPSRMFHGRTMSLEGDFCRNAGIPFEDRAVEDDDAAWRAVRERIDAGEPVMVSTDTFYLGYHNTTSHFPGHRCVVVGYDDESRTVWIADRKFEDYQACSYEELRQARNARDYGMSCHNQFGDFEGDVKLGRPLAEAIGIALRHNALAMLDPETSPFPTGIPGLRRLAADFPSWQAADDWSWAARFGYQVVIKRGAGGSFFRSLYAGFLREASEWLPAIAAQGLPEQMDEIAAGWRGLAALLKEQSERETCKPELFDQAGRAAAELADTEEAFFERSLRLAEGLA